MAANIKDEEERIRRIIVVYNYYIKTNLSTRKLAEIISENEFKISNVTVNEYLKKAIELISEPEKKELQLALEERKNDTNDNPVVRERVLNAAKLYLDGAYIEDIAEVLNSTYFQIYRDLKCRLSKIDNDLYKKVCKQASINNNVGLKNNNLGGIL